MELTDLLPAAQKEKQIGTDRYKFHGWPLQTELAELTYRTWGSRAGPPVWYLLPSAQMSAKVYPE